MPMKTLIFQTESGSNSLSIARPVDETVIAHVPSDCLSLIVEDINDDDIYIISDGAIVKTASQVDDFKRQYFFNTVRGERDNELVKLDTPMLIALGSQDAAEISRIENLKQELRDLPSTLDISSVTTISGLSDAWPSILPNNPYLV